MENSNEKPKKKKFSLFCCFSTNEGGKKRRKKYNSHNNISNSNKTNISSEKNKNIKVNDFSIEGNSYKSKKIHKIPIGNHSKASSISNIKEDIKKIDKLKQQKNDTIQILKI